MMKIDLAFLYCLLLAARLYAADFYVAPSGLDTNDGSLATPWTLTKALSHPATVQPGDTIWLRGGTYTGTFISSLQGSPEAPIKMRQYAGERAVIDGSRVGFTSKHVTTFKVLGQDTWYWGFTVMNSDPERIITVSGSNPSEARGVGVDVLAPRTKLINLLIHDTGQGVGIWKQAPDSEVYGCIIFNNGWVAPDRKHGHGIYTQNETGAKLFKDNIVFSSFENTVNMYGSDQAFLNNHTWDSNVLFKGRLLMGGGTPVKNLKLLGNYGYLQNFELGYSNPNNEDAVIAGNYFYGGIGIKWFQRFDFFDNVVWPGGTFTKEIAITTPTTYDLAEYHIDRNVYYRKSAANVLEFSLATPAGNKLYKFNSSLPSPPNYGSWQMLGFDASGAYFNNASLRPTGTQIFLRPNQYEAGRAHLIIYNWEQQDKILVDLSSVLQSGERYQIRDAQNYVGCPVVRGIYSGPLYVSMNLTECAQPLGDSGIVRTHTAPEFGVFVISKE